MQATMLLCDFAEEINGKLYIMGAGWARLTLIHPVASLSLAILIKVEWTETNVTHRLKAKLVTTDHEPVLIGETPIEVEGEFEVGRPAGVRSGTELQQALALRAESMPLGPGAYEWVLEINGHPAARQPFEVFIGGGA